MVTRNAIGTDNLEFILCQSANALSTGILTGGVITVNGGDASKFDMTAGTGYVINNYTDPAAPVLTRVSFGPFTAETVTNIGTQQLTYISIDSSGSIVEQATDPTQSEKRDLITVAVLSHPNLSTITGIGPVEEFAADVGVQLSDMAVSIGNINRSGNVYSANGANLNIDKSAGETFRLGANFTISKKSPNLVTDASDTGLTFTQLYRDGSGGTTVVSAQTAIDPDQYDDGSGTLAAVPNNRWTIQHITFFTNSDVTFVEYGQNIYTSQVNAESAIQTEDFDSSAILTRGSFRCWLIVKFGGTDLSDTSLATFIEAGKFGSINASGGGGGGGLTDLQGAYDNSITPEIVLDATRGALTITDASSALGAPLFEVQNNAQTTDYMTVDATGVQIDGALTITTPLDEIYGGTGTATYTTGDVLYSSASNTLSKLPIGTIPGDVLIANNSGIPEWNTDIVIINDDFIGEISTTSNTFGWDVAVAAGGALSAITIDSDHPGVWNLKVTAASDDSLMSRGSIAADRWSLVLGGGVIRADFLIKIPTISDATDDISMWIGLSDATPFADISDGVYFEYIRGTSVNWQGYTEASGTRTLATGGSNVAADTNWTHLRIDINAAASSITFYVDGVDIGTSAANIPTAGISPLLKVTKALGSNERNLYIDAFRFYQKLTNSRWI